jgi:hypothetical protein
MTIRDGFRSSVRGYLAPEGQPIYSIWRGAPNESDLSPESFWGISFRPWVIRFQGRTTNCVVATGVTISLGIAWRTELDCLRHIDQPFFTPVYDFCSPTLVFGRAAL